MCVGVRDCESNSTYSMANKGTLALEQVVSIHSWKRGGGRSKGTVARNTIYNSLPATPNCICTFCTSFCDIGMKESSMGMEEWQYEISTNQNEIDSMTCLCHFPLHFGLPLLHLLWGNYIPQCNNDRGRSNKPHQSFQLLSFQVDPLFLRERQA